MSDTKIIAMYLPQFHCIPENDEFWGKGFTDWTTVRKAKPLFNGHQQPRIPLNDNYYDLSIEQNVVWQSQLAHEYGIHGFGVYHYWFNNEKNLLTKPAEIIRDSDNVKINYFLAWDNASWVRSWSNLSGNAWSPVADKNLRKKGPAIMIKYELGEKKDWEKHYQYVLTHFNSSRYIKINNQPVFVILGYSDEIKRMCEYWNILAKKDGYKGIFFIFRHSNRIPKNEQVYRFKYEPIQSGWMFPPLLKRLEMKLCKTFHLKFRLRTFDYDKIWTKIIDNAKKDANPLIFHGGFVSYDDTPRRGSRGIVVKNSNPRSFGEHLNTLLNISKQQQKKFVFLTAWNEWGEGAYLEPDTKDKYDYLNMIRATQRYTT